MKTKPTFDLNKVPLFEEPKQQDIPKSDYKPGFTFIKRFKLSEKDKEAIRQWGDNDTKYG